jgi:hypothetical protein
MGYLQSASPPSSRTRAIAASMSSVPKWTIGYFCSGAFAIVPPASKVMW